MLLRHILIILISLILSNPVWAEPQPGIPFKRTETVVLLAPIQDKTPEQSPAWLGGGLASFIKDNLSGITNLKVLNVRVVDPVWLTNSDVLRRHLWYDNFQSQPLNGYDIYLITGQFGYNRDQVNLHLDLYYLRLGYKLDEFDFSDKYTHLLDWKDKLGNWAREAMGISLSGRQFGRPLDAASVEYFSEPGRAASAKIYRTTPTPFKADTVAGGLYSDQRNREQRSKMLRELWRNILFDPYLAQIRDIVTRPNPYSPDSLDLSFQVIYVVNPRIANILAAFGKHNKGKIDITGKFQRSTFIDLDYNLDFVRELMRGDWRAVPLVKVGKDGYSKQRIFYNTPSDIVVQQTRYKRSMGTFKQLLVALPGVNVVRFYTLPDETTLMYKLTIGRNERAQLDRISVNFIRENQILDYLQ